MPEMKLHRKLFTVQNQYVRNGLLAPLLIDHQDFPTLCQT